MNAVSEFFASLDTALTVAFAIALHGMALLIVGALALILAASAARELGSTGPRWRWFGWFAILKGLAVVASLGMGVAHAEGSAAFFSGIYLAFSLPAWLAGTQFAWASWRARPAWATTRMPALFWVGFVALSLLSAGLQELSRFNLALAATAGAAMLATLIGEIRAHERRGRARAAVSLVLALAGLAGLIGLELKGDIYHGRLQGWTLGTLPFFVRRDFLLLHVGTASATVLAVGWWLWMRLHVKRIAARGWLRHALWVLPLAMIFACVAGFALLNQIKVNGGQRADRAFASLVHTATVGLEQAGWRERDDPAGFSVALDRVAAANPDIAAVAHVRITAQGLKTVAASFGPVSIPARPWLWREGGADDPRFVAARAPFASTFMQDGHDTFTLYCEPWPRPGEGWLIYRVGFESWSTLMGSVLLQATLTILLACVAGVAVVVSLVQRELGAEARLGLVRASAASEAKSGLLTRASHELRTPIQGVLGYAELLSRSALDPRQEEWLRSLRSQGGHLLRLVNDLLDFGALQNGRLNFTVGTVSPAGIAREAVAALRPQAEKRGLALDLAVEPDVPAWVRGDATRLRQILVNLLGNAVKFTVVGGVNLRINTLDTPLPGGRRVLLFTVTDTGPGIDEPDLPGVFDLRGRLSRHPAEGAGLGLALTKSLCLAMGGDLRVTSEPGVGSAFTASVALPTAPAPIVLKSATAAPLPRLGLRVLVVEDNAALRLLVAAWLDELHCASALAESGERALELADRDTFDAVILDLGLPGIDGREVARRLRARPACARLWIVGLSAHAAEPDRVSALAAGMDVFLSKPVELPALAAALDQAARRPVSSMSSEGLLASPLLGADGAGALRALARQDMTARRDELRSALLADDWPRVAKIAHYLANTADLLGDSALRSACRACEDAVLAGDADRAREAAALVLSAPIAR